MCDRPIGSSRERTTWQTGRMPCYCSLYYIILCKRGIRILCRHCEVTEFEDRRPSYRTSPLQLVKLLHIVKALVRGIQFEYLRLLSLPFHIGPTATDPLCEPTINLLQLPFHIGPAATNLLCLSILNLLPTSHFANQHWTCCHSSRSTLWTLSTTCCCYCCCCTPIATYW